MKKTSAQLTAPFAEETSSLAARSSTMYLVRLRSRLSAAKPLSYENAAILNEAHSFRCKKR